MKIAVVSESEADDAAIRLFVEEILKPTITDVTFVEPSLRSRGWPGLERSMPRVLKWLHYQRKGDGLVVVADSDDSVVHRPAHESAGAGDPNCRLCLLRQRVEETRQQLAPVEGYAPIRVAVGVAVPSIEAWLRFGHDPACSEAGWIECLERGLRSPPAVQQLKRDVYGTDRPSLALEISRMSEEVTRLIADDKLEALEQSFPNGFGFLANNLREWAAE